MNQLDSAHAVRQIARAGLSQRQALGQLAVKGQAVMLATDKLFLTLSVLMTIAGLSIWVTAKPGQGAGSVAAH